MGDESLQAVCDRLHKAIYNLRAVLRVAKRLNDLTRHYLAYDCSESVRVEAITAVVDAIEFLLLNDAENAFQAILAEKSLLERSVLEQKPSDRKEFDHDHSGKSRW